MVVFVINFLGNIFRFRLLRKGKITTLTLHLSFILILTGAFVTRYIGYEGVMAIGEGETSNEMLSEHAYLNVFIDGDYIVDGQQQRLRLAPKKMDLSERLSNRFSMSKSYNGTPVTIRYKGFIKGATKGMIEDEAGDGYLKIVEAGDGNRHDHYVKVGEVTNIHNILFAINNPTKGAINILYDQANESYQIEPGFNGEYMRMADQQKGVVLKDSLQDLQLRSLYQMAGMAFVVPDPVVKGRMGITKAPVDEPVVTNALLLDVSSGGETKTLELLGGKGSTPNPVKVDVNGLEVYATYGSKKIELPFSLTLNDFIADKYPGTEKSYKSFKSKVTVNNADGTFQEEEIFMNNVLDKSGFRFFQSGFQPDEKGTILAVNHDIWGTWITYLGYFLLYFGLMAILFDRNSRFGELKKYLNKIKRKKKRIVDYYDTTG
jgi:hypothetical protein